jgi:hypothetical protein
MADVRLRLGRDKHVDVTLHLETPRPHSSAFGCVERLRAFLVDYEQCLSLAIAADRTKISGRLPYLWKNRKDRTGRWFVLALTRAEHAGVQRLRGEGVSWRHVLKLFLPSLSPQTQ